MQVLATCFVIGWLGPWSIQLGWPGSEEPSGLGDGSIDNGNRRLQESMLSARKLLLHQEIALILRDNLTCYTFDGHDALMLPGPA